MADQKEKLEPGHFDSAVAVFVTPSVPLENFPGKSIGLSGWSYWFELRKLGLRRAFIEFVMYIMEYLVPLFRVGCTNSLLDISSPSYDDIILFNQSFSFQISFNLNNFFKSIIFKCNLRTGVLGLHIRNREKTQFILPLRG